MEIIPAIDLLGGKCVRLFQGDYSKVTEFESDPVQQALIWQRMGASRLHLVDLDGAKTGKPVNNETIKSIRKSLSIPMQIGGGIRSVKRAEELIEIGVDQVILGTIAIENQAMAIDLSNKHPDKIIIGIDAKDGKVVTRGWLKKSETSANELVQSFSNTKISRLICTDISKDGTLEGPNLNFLREVASESKVPIIASGGIGSIGDIISLIPLEQCGICGVIVGRALYEGKINLEEAIEMMANHDIQDVNFKNDFYA
ncbi:1-(5-phosphoribosyl)-5-[(5-phosphoribosylamino)methylideneamino]imidazole-4-carboxamide isomerase [Prochlorococcus marinus]|uniref:1-(5-phosphoribosyl)-5-[(5- phosphoribosylamino)methylideneamino]imidazole-4- carboxamide isomerase n=1 Tax=Prochlorococcus marinus TaxID=1219 RepID=UPI0022B4E1E4|nr:1-(5-phosphoribosyl)-5-[(5-phosphoribosylamino)methylideneamino]imidazole-4-carboxamide isomerase [Prochlorococcus marinus]